MKFDTLDKKPKLYGLLIPGVLTAALILVLSLTGIEKHAVAISAVTAAFILVSVVFLIVVFFRQLRYNPYSYNTIYYAGFALFLLSVFVLLVNITVNLVRYPEEYRAARILYTLLSSAKAYMLISAPFILLFSAGLCISNISLIRHEGFRPVNGLGIILSVLLLGGEVLLFRLDYYASGSKTEVMMHDLFTNLFAAVYLYFECMMIGTIIAGIITSRYEPEPDKDFLIILGCSLRKDGSPTPLLRGRIDRALAFYEKQKKKTGKDLIFITSGGQGPDEVISESAAMKAYLMEKGIPEKLIVEEDQSANTLENMKFSLEKIRSINPEGKTAFSTTNYHVFRSGLWARRVKLRAVGMGAETKWYFWPNAAVREFAGLLKEHKGKQTVILSLLVVFYVALTFLVYR